MAQKKSDPKTEKGKFRDKAVPESKKQLVAEIVEKIKKNKTLFIASTKGLPSSQFQQIKKNLRGKAEVKVVKKSIVLRAIAQTEKGSLQGIKEKIGSDVALFFSNEDPFVLSSLLADNQGPTKARPGDIAPEDIVIEPGPTDLMPGPAISELSSVGLKVSVENGKLAIKQGKIVAKKGEIIKENVSNVLSKLNIMPMKVGFEPIAAYDSQADKVYIEIQIDKPGTLKSLREMISKALGFATNRGYVVKENISYFIAKAGIEEKAINACIQNKSKEEQK